LGSWWEEEAKEKQHSGRFCDSPESALQSFARWWPCQKYQHHRLPFHNFRIDTCSHIKHLEDFERMHDARNTRALNGSIECFLPPVVSSTSERVNAIVPLRSPCMSFPNWSSARFLLVLVYAWCSGKLFQAKTPAPTASGFHRFDEALVRGHVRASVLSSSVALGLRSMVIHYALSISNACITRESDEAFRGAIDCLLSAIERFLALQRLDVFAALTLTFPNSTFPSTTRQPWMLTR
jgi:hypothetical protein